MKLCNKNCSAKRYEALIISERSVTLLIIRDNPTLLMIRDNPTLLIIRETTKKAEDRLLKKSSDGVQDTQ